MLSLSEINLSNFNVVNAKDLSWMFANCTSLTSIDLSTFNTKKNTNINYMFYSCLNLKYVDISSFTTTFQSVSLFNNLPDSGNIKIKSEFYDKISSQIPSDWYKNII